MITIRHAAIIGFGTLLVSACGGRSVVNPPTSLVPAAAHMAQLPAPKPYAKGLLALYRFNGTLNDSSGHGHTAKDTGKANYVNGAPFGGKAIEFDGEGKAIVKAPLDISIKKIPQLSMGGWFKATSISTPPYGIVSNDDGDYDRTLDIDNRDAKTGAHWSAFVGGKVVGAVRVHIGRWVFSAVTYDQSTLPGTYAFYVNNGSRTSVLKGQANFDSASVTKNVTIGRNPNFDQPLAGDAANVFFYVGILSKTQIAKIIAHGPSRIP